jgi:hypothetical protein
MRIEFGGEIRPVEQVLHLLAQLPATAMVEIWTEQPPVSDELDDMIAYTERKYRENLEDFPPRP